MFSSLRITAAVMVLVSEAINVPVAVYSPRLQSKFEVLQEIASARGESGHAVTIAWVRAQQARSVIVPVLGARRRQQLEDNLGTLELELTATELARLEEVSRIQLGFPHDFGADRLAYGTTRPLIDNHRPYGPGQARRQA